MSEVVKSDVSHALRFEQFRKALSDIVRLDQIANLVDAYIVKIVLDVAASAQPAIFLLFLSECKKSVSHKWNKRKRPHAGFGLCGIGCNQDHLAVHLTGSNRVPDSDGVLVKINGIPFQTDCLAAAQTVERAEQDRKLKLAAFCRFKESVDLISIIEAADISVSFGIPP